MKTTLCNQKPTACLEDVVLEGQAYKPYSEYEAECLLGAFKEALVVNVVQEVDWCIFLRYRWRPYSDIYTYTLLPLIVSSDIINEIWEAGDLTIEKVLNDGCLFKPTDERGGYKSDIFLVHNNKEFMKRGLFFDRIMVDYGNFESCEPIWGTKQIKRFVKSSDRRYEIERDNCNYEIFTYNWAIIIDDDFTKGSIVSLASAQSCGENYAFWQEPFLFIDEEPSGELENKIKTCCNIIREARLPKKTMCI